MHVQLQHSEAYQNCQSCRKITHSVKLKKTLFKALFFRGVNEPELEIILGIIYKNIKNMSLKLKKKIHEEYNHGNKFPLIKDCLEY